MKSNAVIEQSKELYHQINETVDNNPTDTAKTIPDKIEKTDKAEESSAFDELGRLKEFSELLEINTDIKGWISIPGTNIDYPVLQSLGSDPEYYLTRNINKETDKMGSIFIDVNSSVEDKTKNLVIHGHNMTSTDNMFHYLLKYDSIDYYIEHPLIQFDTIYEKGTWKIISIFKANANVTEDFFNYTKSTFKDDTDYLEFIYQLRTRSIYNLPVDTNENDPIITLSTCSYELDNYRTVIVARKVREGESTTVEVEQAAKNPAILYPANWYGVYGGKPPVLKDFADALRAGEVAWYRSK
jgi:sortase B